MSYPFDVREINSSPILYQRRRVTRENIGPALAEIFPAVHAYAAQNGFALTGAPLVRYTGMESDGFEIEAGIPVASGAKGSGEIELGALPAGKAAVTLHKGPYEDLHKAHTALEAWLKSSKYEAAGAPWESYINDPGEHQPADYETEIFAPVRLETS